MNFDRFIKINSILLKCYYQFVIIIHYQVPQGMFKNVPLFKTNVAIRMQVKHLLKVNSLSDLIYY